MSKRIRHILGLSGGKDSTGLAILLHKLIPDLEFFFCDTGKELPETYEYLNRIETRLGIKISRLNPDKGFDFWLDFYVGYLPSAQARWCTRRMKLEPLEKFVGSDFAYSYVGIRADENRSGYLGLKGNIKPVYIYKDSNFKAEYLGKTIYDQKKIMEEFETMGVNLPIREKGYSIDDVRELVETSGIGMPKYYEWRTRSGCFFCFFQRKFEWVMLAERHPHLFQEAMKYEKALADGRRYTWCQRETLQELLTRRNEIISNYEKDAVRKKKENSKRPLSEVLSSVLDEEDFDKPCLMCTL